MAQFLIGPAVTLLARPSVDLLLSIVTENIKLISGFEKQLGHLKDEVEMIQAVLDDAERRSLQDKAVKLWLKKLADFAYKATDALDEFAYHALRRKVKKVSSFTRSSSNPSILSKRKMGKKIKKLLASLKKINNQATDYGLQRGEGHAHALPPHVVREGRETTSFVDVSEQVVGREGDITKIVKMLTSQNNQPLSVLPIVAMGGQGKTILAKQIYNHDGVKSHFDNRTWLCVSDEFNVKWFFKNILESLMGEKCKLDTKEEILKELQKKLGGKKYLLVLDDVWEENRNKWNGFVSELRSANTSGVNTILVTTRSTQVAKLVGTFDQPYSLEGLSNDDCWSIFSARAFPNGVRVGFEAIGREIVKKCRGLPLAAKVVGSMLCSKREIHEWRSIDDNKVWNYDGSDGGVLQILKLSYDNLPLPLKRCFSYCSIFRKDSVMRKDELIQQWMALGYLQPLQEHNNIEIQDIGNIYFNILVERSLFQDITTNNFGVIKSCKMHDLVHDLAQSLSKNDVFFAEGSDELESGVIPHGIWHLALYSCRVNLHTIGRQGSIKLRTLFLSNIEIGKGLVDFKCLRILKLAEIGELPTSISQLIHLRYLDLSETSISVLPDAISKLYQLQSLRLSYVNYLPNGMRNLIGLRHFHFKSSGLEQVPLNLGSLTYLQRLSLFIVGKEKGCQIEELGSLENLGGKLRIRSLENVRSKEDAEMANLSKKTKLEKLIFRWDMDFSWNWGMEDELDSHVKNNACDVLEGLQPHPNLKSLCIMFFGGDNFPFWMMNMAVNVGGSQLLLENLVDIRLSLCRVKEIPKLGHLPFLRRLRLKRLNRLKCIGESFYGYNGSSSSRKTVKLFPALEELALEIMKNLEEWMGAPASQDEVVVFPCLEKLNVSDCEKLKTAPMHFPCLKILNFARVNSGSPLLSICSSSSKLSTLHIVTVPELIYLPDGLFHNNRYQLMELSILNCEMLESLPKGLQSCISLRSLDVSFCGKLKSIPSFEGLNSFARLNCSRCHMLESLPQGLQSLSFLDVGGCENLNLMASVEDINGCSKVTSLPLYLTHLETLVIGGTTLKDIQHLQECVSLRTLILIGQPECDTLPEQIQYLTALTFIQLECYGVEALPDWFGNLESLEEIKLFYMKKLKFLPSMEAVQRLANLRRLKIEFCPLLQARCEDGDRPEWSKISGIPDITIV